MSSSRAGCFATFQYCRMGPRVVCQHPLAYPLGLEGLALLRAFSGALYLPARRAG
jgi:hypothetical protein